MDSKLFKNKVLSMIETCSSNFFLVVQDRTIQCSCLNHTTKQPSATCQKCLGTGYKVVIKKSRGACWEEMKGGATLSSKTSRIMRTYYMDPKYPIAENNLIIDHNEIYYVYRVATMRGLNGEITHKQVTSVLKSEDHDKVYKNFKKVIDKKLTVEQRGEFPWLI